MIKTLLSKTILAMFMDKKARKKFNTMQLEGLYTKDNVQTKDKLHQTPSTNLRVNGNERKILIEQAMALRIAKSHIFDQLDRKKFTKLRTLAGKALYENTKE